MAERHPCKRRFTGTYSYLKSMNILKNNGGQGLKFEEIESKESQLWWLALIVIALLAATLYAVDKSNSQTPLWSIPQLQIALSTKFFRGVLLVATLLICAYFRDTARRLRRHNAELISDLSEHGRQLERKNREVSRLKELSDQLIGLTDLGTAMDLVLNMAVEVIGADTASILLRNKNEDIMRIVSSCGIPKNIVKSTTVRVGESLAGLVAQDGRPMIINSDEVEGNFAEHSHRKDSIVSSAIAPIQLDNYVRGVVNIAKRRPGACFTDEDLGVLSTLANQCSLVIQKADLLSDLRNQVEILASTVEELRQAQAELKQSEKLASIGQLAGGVAHEIRNPLQVIQGRMELLLLDEHSEEMTADLKCVLEHIGRISDIVSNLLSFSRQSKDADFRDLNISEVAEKTLNLLEPQVLPDNIVIIRDFDKEIPPIYGNPGQLQQVFTNLALNAYQAMRESNEGTLTVSVKPRKGEVVVEFSDTGPGIAKENMEQLFEPFFTTKPEGQGTGLGLSIAYGIIQIHGGTINVKSTVGKGTKFTLSFPIVPNDIAIDNEQGDGKKVRKFAPPSEERTKESVKRAA